MTHDEDLIRIPRNVLAKVVRECTARQERAIIAEHAELSKKCKELEAERHGWAEAITAFSIKVDSLWSQPTNAELRQRVTDLQKELQHEIDTAHTPDDPSLDGTPNAHPAFWRGVEFAAHWLARAQRPGAANFVRAEAADWRATTKESESTP